jgi:hypothetical protein
MYMQLYRPSDECPCNRRQEDSAFVDFIWTGVLGGETLAYHIKNALGGKASGILLTFDGLKCSGWVRSLTRCVECSQAPRSPTDPKKEKKQRPWHRRLCTAISAHYSDELTTKRVCSCVAGSRLPWTAAEGLRKGDTRISFRYCDYRRPTSLGS